MTMVRKHKHVYTVSEAAALLGVTNARIYQLLREARGKEEGELPASGQYLRGATHEQMRAAGVHPDVVTYPARWIPAEELERYVRLTRQ